MLCIDYYNLPKVQKFDLAVEGGFILIDAHMNQQIAQPKGIKKTTTGILIIFNFIAQLSAQQVDTPYNRGLTSHNIISPIQSYYKFEVDTVHYFQMVKGKSITENIDSNLIEHTGYGYGRVDTWEIDLENKTVDFGVGKNPIIKYEQTENALNIEYMAIRLENEKFFLTVSIDKETNRPFILYLKDSTYGGGFSFIN